MSSTSTLDQQTLKPEQATLVAARPGRVTAEEETQLARQWHATACREARDRLVTANLGLVVSIAQRYSGGGVPLEELIAEGNLGLLHAVDGFDPECGSRFSTYAAYWIRQGISRAFAAASPRGHLSGRDRHALAEFDRAARSYYARSGQVPTDDDLCRELGWSVRRVAACRQFHLAYSRPSSLEQARGAGRDPAAKDGSDPDRLPAETDNAAQATRLLRLLSGPERTAVELRYGLLGSESQRVDAIAKTLNRTRRETKALIRSALAKLSRYAKPHRFVADRSPDQAARRHVGAGLAAVA